MFDSVILPSLSWIACSRPRLLADFLAQAALQTTMPPGPSNPDVSKSNSLGQTAHVRMSGMLATPEAGEYENLGISHTLE